MLGMPEARVRELARDALVELAPVSVRGVEEDWRGQLADYVLGQQSGPEATATKGHLRRSEAARSWARSLLDSLEQLYENGSVPAIPEGERGRGGEASACRSRGVRAGPERRRPARTLDGDPVMRRRLIAGAGVALVVLLLAVLVWPIGVLTGDDNKSSDQAASNGAQPAGGTTTTAGSRQTNGQPAGIAIVVDRNGKKQLLVQAARLAPSGQNEGYYVWLYNSQNDAKSLGGQVTDQKGNYQAIGPLPGGLREVQVHRHLAAGRSAAAPTVKHSGDSVLRGPMPKIKAARRAPRRSPSASARRCCSRRLVG